MDHSFLVGEIERGRRLTEEPRRLFDGEPPRLLEQLREGLALDELHHDEAHVRPIDDVVDGHDMRMFELGRDLRLADGALAKLFPLIGVGERVEANSFDRDVALEHRVLDAVDLTESAGTEPRHELVAGRRGLPRAL